MKEYDFFSSKELSCSCEECDMQMDEIFMKKVIAMRIACNFPFIVTSAARCPKYNNLVAKSGLTGPHTTGRAMDVHVQGHNAFKFIESALANGMTGIGLLQKGVHKGRYIHIDDLPLEEGRPRPWVWTY